MELELSEPVTSLADAVLEARKMAGLSQEKLAQKANLSVRTVRLIERGASDPRESTVNAIGDALEIPTYVLRCMATSDEERRKISTLLDVYHKHRDRQE